MKTQLGCLTQIKQIYDDIVLLITVYFYTILVIKPTNTHYLRVTPNCLQFTSSMFWPLMGHYQVVFINQDDVSVFIFLSPNSLTRGHAVAQLVEGNALQAGRSRVRFPMVSLEFFINIIFLAALWPWGVDSASNRKEYQEYFLGDKGGRCVGLTTLPPSCADGLEIWEPQSPGKLGACPGLYRNCFIVHSHICRSQRPRGLRRWSASARLLRLWVRIPLGLGSL